MSEKSQIKAQINNILKNIQLPKEIKSTINSIYKEYETAYGKLILGIKQKNVIDSREIQQLENYINNDYIEDIRMSEIVEYEEYEQKRTKIVEVIGKVLKEINNKEKGKIIQKVERPTEKENNKSANIMVNITISEIESSTRNIEKKLNKLKDKNQSLEPIIVEFEQEVETIIECAKQRIPEILEVLNNHYEEVCEKLSAIIERYNNELETKEETHMGNRREEFAKRISDYEQIENIQVNEEKQNKEVEELEI